MKQMYFGFLTLILFVIKLFVIVAQVFATLFDNIKDEIDELYLRLLEHRSKFVDERDK